MLEREITHSKSQQVHKSLHLKYLSTFLTFLFLFFTLSTARANNEAPKMINLQAVLVDDGGNILYDLQEADITFSIIDGAGTTHYQETQHVPVVGGAISVLVGSGTPAEGFSEGGIPYDAIDPDGSRLLRIKLDDATIPQEDLELVSVPYSYYAQYALQVDKDAIESPHILDGTIQQVDLSSDLLTYIDDSIAGVSQADLDKHKTEFGDHTAGIISVNNSFNFASGSDLQSILEGFDNSFSLVVGNFNNHISLTNTSAHSFTNISGQVSTSQIADNAVTTGKILDGTITPSDLSSDFNGWDKNASDDITTAGGTISGGNLTLSGRNIVMSASNTVDGVDVDTHNHSGAGQGGTVGDNSLSGRPNKTCFVKAHSTKVSVPTDSKCHIYGFKVNIPNPLTSIVSIFSVRDRGDYDDNDKFSFSEYLDSGEGEAIAILIARNDLDIEYQILAIGQTTADGTCPASFISTPQSWTEIRNFSSNAEDCVYNPASDDAAVDAAF